MGTFESEASMEGGSEILKGAVLRIQVPHLAATLHHTHPHYRNGPHSQLFLSVKTQYNLKGYNFICEGEA
jgi:hypothetical protein